MLQISKTIENLKNQIKGFRSGTISPAFVSSIKVMYDGQMTPIGELAFSTTTKNGVMTTLFDLNNPHLLGQINNVLKACGLNSYIFSKTAIMVSIPPITGEEKTKVHKQIKKLGEDAKIAVRNIRKNMKKEKELGL